MWLCDILIQTLCLCSVQWLEIMNNLIREKGSVCDLCQIPFEVEIGIACLPLKEFFCWAGQILELKPVF